MHICKLLLVTKHENKDVNTSEVGKSLLLLSQGEKSSFIALWTDNYMTKDRFREDTYVDTHPQISPTLPDDYDYFFMVKNGPAI